MLTVNRTAIEHNVAVLREAAGAARFMAVVKDNAYGHGLVPVATAAIAGGADWLGVVHVREGVELRTAGLTAPILVLGYVPPEDIPLAVQHRIDVPLMDLEHASLVRTHIPPGRQLRVHLKVETGLNRFGLEGRELSELAKFAGFLPSASNQQRGFAPIGIYSHLAAVEDAELEFTRTQIRRFADACGQLGLDDHSPIIRHLAATAATLVLPESHFDMVRCGIGIYGLWPSTDVRQLMGNDQLLRPALSWHEPIVGLKSLTPGSSVGYGCTWRPKRESTVGLLAVGYADGLARAFSNAGVVVVNGVACPIVGRVCSNVTFVDVTNVNNVSVGDQAVIYMADTASPAALDVQAERAGTISYELIMRLAPCLEREYVR